MIKTVLFCCGCLLIHCRGLAYDSGEKGTKSGFLMGAEDQHSDGLISQKTTVVIGK
ncbi:hypothetical protein KAW50_04540 [candidate division WOR-3 bacterium]|nr:hypothetical protein [candidate division WOR-3 bacterium]